MRKLIALTAALALLLALCACGKSAVPSDVTTAFDLAAFAEAPLAFDLTDLARFLAPPQLADLETSLRADLAARGLEDYATLHFADPPEGSVKIPFANESGADLSNINIGELAKHICGQVEVAFEGKGVDVGTSTANTITTKSTTASVTTITTTTTKPATEKPGVWTPPPQITVAELDALFEVMPTSKRVDFTFAEKPKRISISNHEGSWEIVRASCTPETYYDGATYHIFLDKERDGICKYIGDIHDQYCTGDDLKYYTTGFILSRGDIKTETKGSIKRVVVDASIFIRSPYAGSSPTVDIDQGTAISTGMIEADGAHIYKLNSNGTGFYKVEVSDIKW